MVWHQFSQPKVCTLAHFVHRRYFCWVMCAMDLWSYGHWDTHQGSHFSKNYFQIIFSNVLSIDCSPIDSLRSYPLNRSKNVWMYLTLFFTSIPCMCLIIAAINIYHVNFKYIMRVCCLCEDKWMFASLSALLRHISQGFYVLDLLKFKRLVLYKKLRDSFICTM